MGGATRGERKRRQQARSTPPKLRPTPRDRRVKVGVITAVVIVAVMATIYVVLNRPWAGPQQAAASSFPVSVDGVVVRAGQPNAAVTVDVYEDYLCPICERFENRYGPQLTTALNEGRAKVNYHAVTILDDRTDPPGYSTLAANAALCAVPAGIWPAFHSRLYTEQPAEGSAGQTAAQLSAIGTSLGAGPAFTQCVEANGNAPAIRAATQAAVANPALQTDGQFGTPTVTVNGNKVDVSDTNWLQQALGS